MKNIIMSMVALLMMASVSMAKETYPEKAETAKNKAVDASSRTGRAVKDKACEAFNEKGECLSQKIENKAKNLKDSTATKANEVKNKID